MQPTSCRRLLGTVLSAVWGPTATADSDILGCSLLWPGCVPLTSQGCPSTGPWGMDSAAGLHHLPEQKWSAGIGFAAQVTADG